MDQSNKIVEDLLKQARQADAIDRDRIEAFEKIISTPGWAVYIELLNAKIQAYADQLLVPSGSIDGCVAQEYVKGAMSGLIMARDIPNAIIAAKDQIRSVAAEEDENVDS